jgi:hypothetical protein
MDNYLLSRLCRDGKIEWTLHAVKRVRERNIPFGAVINAIIHGEIIQEYHDDNPYPSCLICHNDKFLPIHVVVSSNNEIVYIITAYIPSDEKWENDNKTRKGKI